MAAGGVMSFSLVLVFKTTLLGLIAPKGWTRTDVPC